MQHQTPPPTAAMELLGDTHSLCIVYHLSQKKLRFCELQRATGDLNPRTLSGRLKKLEDEQIILRKEETIDKVSVVYELTKKGRDVLPIIDQIFIFSEKHYASEN